MIRAAASLLCAGLAAAPPQAPPYRPDLAQWRLEVSPDLGGWTTSSTFVARIKIVDPRDPEPPKEVALPYGYAEDWDAEGADGDEGEADADDAAAAAARRLAADAQQRRNAWRDRRLRMWFNGSDRTLSARVGYSNYETLLCQDGENRLEILEPDSGLRVVRTWWTFAGRTRLVVRRVQVESDGGWGGGTLEVIEPNGDVASAWRKTPSGGQASGDEYTHRTPPAGTYTLRWTAVHRGGTPFTVTVETVLDAGTEREKRWTFSRLMIPGAGASTLGTLDVEP